MTDERELPPDGEQPPPKVIQELLEAFGDDVGPESRAHTRPMSDTELGARADEAAEAAPPPPQPEATRRSRRRSRREQKREAKREAKRLAALEKERSKQAAAQAKRDAKLAKQQRKAERTAAKQQKDGRRPQLEVDVEGSGGGGEQQAGDVRILTPAEAAAITGAAQPEAAEPAAETAPRTTVSIADDGLPDAVYLEGELGSGGSAEVGVSPSELGDSRVTVFIDDRAGATGEVVPLDVATSAARMEPRIRERRLAVKRAAGRKRLKWVAIVTAVFAVIVATLAILGSGLFAIRDVDIDGAVYSRGAALDDAVARLEGANVLRVDTGEVEALVEAIPWVADARVSTDFPNGARIEVRERRPVIAYLGDDMRYRVLDRNGRVLDVIAGRPVDYLELIVSDPQNLDAGRTAPAGYRAAATLAAALTPQMRQLVTSVSANAEATELSLTLEGDIQVRFGAAEDLVDKLVRLQTVLTDPDPESVPMQLIDVSTNAIVIR